MCHTDIPPGQSTPEIAGSEVTIPLPGGHLMPALHIAPDPSAPAVLIVGDVFGRSAFYEHLAALVATAGFQALVPDFYFRQGPLPVPPTREAAFERRSRLDESGAVDDLRGAIDWLRETSSQTRVGTIGFCMGGTFALDLASAEQDLVTIAYYGFPVLSSSLPAPPPAPIDLVDNLHGPVLAFWGSEDEAVGVEHARRYAELASSSNPDFEFEIVSGLGHGFLGSARLGDRTDPGAATWDRTLALLQTHLARPGA
jgi:carboxymethylenebutenolidase